MDGLQPETPHRLSADTPTMRLFGLLEIMAGQDRHLSLQDLVEQTGMPKPTVHRMLQQLESSGLLLRESDGRHYGIGSRLRRLAENLLLNDSKHGARHAVLRQLVDDLGETCNITALSGTEVLYLDRVETEAPLRFYLYAGARVPVHCSASGKVLLAQLSAPQRMKLLSHLPMQRYTPNTLTTVEQFEEEIAQVKLNGYAFDNEEYLSGLFCVAVLVPRQDGKSNMAVATQAPIMRMTPDKALRCLPALQRAAAALARIEAEF